MIALSFEDLISGWQHSPFVSFGGRATDPIFKNRIHKVLLQAEEILEIYTGREVKKTKKTQRNGEKQKVRSQRKKNKCFKMFCKDPESCKAKHKAQF